MRNNYAYSGLFLGISLSIIHLFDGLAFAFPQELSLNEIDAVASQTTVLIAEGIHKGDYEQGSLDEDPQVGSGVLVARKGSTYYVLTALHNIRTKGVTYGVRTPTDQNVHFFKYSNIIPLGKELKLGKSIQGFDLALVQFKSNKNYQLATLGNSEKLSLGHALYISGWPMPDDLSVRRERVLREGQLHKLVRQPIKDGGYSMLYSNITRRGMSGGPVFNTLGELVGIHGRGRGKAKEYCVDSILSLKNSCGMQTLHFLSEADSRNIRLKINYQPVTSKQIKKGIKNKRKADFVDNIYKDFSQIESQLKFDRPTGGCESILLGDPC